MNRLCRFDILVFLIAFSLLPCISLGVVASVWAETNEEDLNPVLPRKDTEGGNTPDKALNFKKDDIQRWFERIQNFIKAQNTNRAQLFNSVLDLKVFQTNVFFGTALAVFLVLILLFFGKFSRCINDDCDDVDAPALSFVEGAAGALQVRHAMAGQFKISTGIGAGRHLHLDFAIDCFNINFRAQCRFNYANMLVG